MSVKGFEPGTTAHIITYKSPEGVRGRFFDPLTDEQFQALPYVREKGHLPKGYCAYHVDSRELPCNGVNGKGSERVERLASLPILENFGGSIARPHIVFERIAREEGVIS